MFECPKPAAIPNISDYECPINFDQIVKIIFQRSGYTFASEAALKDLATWTPLLTATDDTKVQVTPYFSGLVLPPSEPLTEGGNDNSTVNGIPLYLGEGFIGVAGQFIGLPPSVAEQLRDYTVESISSIGVTDLVAYFVNRFGQLIHNNLTGFPIYNWRLSSVGSEGFNKHNKTNFSFSMTGEWDAAAVVTKPTFNPLTAL